MCVPWAVISVSLCVLGIKVFLWLSAHSYQCTESSPTWPYSWPNSRKNGPISNQSNISRASLMYSGFTSAWLFLLLPTKIQILLLSRRCSLRCQETGPVRIWLGICSDNGVNKLVSESLVSRLSVLPSLAWVWLLEKFWNPTDGMLLEHIGTWESAVNVFGAGEVWGSLKEQLLFLQLIETLQEFSGWCFLLRL